MVKNVEQNAETILMIVWDFVAGLPLIQLNGLLVFLLVTFQQFCIANTIYNVQSDFQINPRTLCEYSFLFVASYKILVGQSKMFDRYNKQ